MIIDLTNPSQIPIASLELSPPERIDRSGNANEADLRVMFTKQNKIIVQNIVVQPFTEAVVPTSDNKLLDKIIDPYLSKWQQYPEYKVMTALLTCVPDHECRFVWLRVSVELGAQSESGFRPIACKLYPETNKDTIKLNSKIEVSGELSLEVIKTGIKSEEGTEYDRHEYNITTLGEFSYMPAWDFKKTKVNPEITGDLLLVMIIGVLPGATYLGKLSVSAQAELHTGFPPIPLITSRTINEAVKVSFTI